MSNLGAKQMVELLDGLRGTFRDFVEREQRLNQGHLSEMTKNQRRYQETLAEHESWLTGERTAADSDFEDAKQRVESRHARRKSRINQACANIRQRHITDVEAQEAKQKFEIQRDLLQASRDQEARVKETENAYHDYMAALASEREALSALESRTRRVFGGYPGFRKMLAVPPAGEGVDQSRDQNQSLQDLRALLEKTRVLVSRFGGSPFPVLFRFVPRWLWVVLIILVHATLTPAFHPFKFGPFSYQNIAISVASSLVAVFVIHFLGGRLSLAAATAIATAIGKARSLSGACEQKCLAHYQQEVARIQGETESRTQSRNEEWRRAGKDAAMSRAEQAVGVNQRAMRALEKNDQVHQRDQELVQQQHEERASELAHSAESRKSELEATHAQATQKVETEYQAQWQALVAEWNERMQSFNDAVRAAREFADKYFPEWSLSFCQQWAPPDHFAHGAKFGRVEVDVAALAGTLPKDKRLTFPGAMQFQVPLMLAVPHEASIVFETGNAGRKQVVGALNDLILRLLSVAPPGRVKFTIIDPVELGQNFAGVMHLADFEESLISNRIWTQTAQIEQQLADLNEHIEKVTQMYLRNEYATITEYNEQAGRIAEKYHFLVIADFPVNFSELAAKRLQSICASGPRCGVYTLLHWDQRRPAPAEIVPEEVKKNSLWLQAKGDSFVPAARLLEGTKLSLDPAPDPELATEFLQRVGKASIDSNRVEMPFEEAAPEEAEVWTTETTHELRVPVGRTGATKLQYLALGKGTRQHALIAGKTGSGKSTLFHVMITNLALWCSPEQVEFYLVDFKKGVEFKCYATNRLPHARVVAIESDREFGLSVLQRVDEELKRRGDLFRKLGVQDVAGYKKAGGTEPIPRTLLIIDEFQEFFVEDDRVSQNANLLLDRLVRQGRAFGIHVLLGSQTLGGAYTLARATLGQMVVRIALQCNEADAYLIMDENNSAPRLLSRPGEAIYNDAAGALEGNSPFQVVWLPDDTREVFLAKVRERANKSGSEYPGPIVFEGNAPASVAENLLLRGLLEASSLQPSKAPRAWLGAPNSIKGPTEVVFHRQSGNNLLIVGQRDEAALAILAVSLVSLAAQQSKGEVRFVILDCSPPDTPHRQFLEKVVAAVPHEVALARNADVEEIMAGLAADLEKHSEPAQAGAAPATYLFIHGLSRFKKLRYDDDLEFSMDASKAAHPAVQLNKLMCEGASLGMHVICSCDNYNNVSRYLSRKALGEFDLRVLFQMSANDSAALIDSPKAGNLGLYRAILFNEQEGYLETFRPYSLPDNAWIEKAARDLKRLLG